MIAFRVSRRPDPGLAGEGEYAALARFLGHHQRPAAFCLGQDDRAEVSLPNSFAPEIGGKSFQRRWLSVRVGPS